MKISVIISAYNSEKYLEECLNSVLNQTMEDYEVIVVNDGSTDGTQEILNRYQEMYSHLMAFEKENGGPSSARNLGMEKASGEYLYFMDSDDILEHDALEAMYDRAEEEKADLVVASYDIFDEDRTYKIYNLNEILDEDSIQKYELKLLWTFSLWNKLFKKETIDQHQFTFPPISYSEDGVFTMRFVYCAEKITGLNKVIYHYRRMTNGDAITSTISSGKIRDYIQAHDWILESAEESVLTDFPAYHSMQEAEENIEGVKEYIFEILKKEIRILLDQFYVKFWDLDEECLSLLVEEIKFRMSQLDLPEIMKFVNDYPDISCLNLADTHEKAMEKMYFAVSLYGGAGETEEEFLRCLQSLQKQNMIPVGIYLPEQKKELIKREEMLSDNLIFVEAETEEELFTKTLDRTPASYILFASPQFTYVKNVMKFVYKKLILSRTDIYMEQVYHGNYGDLQPVFYHELIYHSYRYNKEDTDIVYFDSLLENKFFSVEFVRRNRMASIPIREQVDHLLHKGYYQLASDQMIVYEEQEENFLNHLTNQKSRDLILSYMEEKEKLSLKDSINEPVEVLAKLQLWNGEKVSDKIIRRAISHCKHMVLEDRTVFITPRSDGKLEGSMKEIYLLIQGKKVICAKKLPHSTVTAVKFLYYVMTSRVIITDDYLKYLRYFELRPEQRVVQLWHACGAFKKFGQRGTALDLPTDRATHIQYNMICVSSEEIRSLYADAFDTDIRKVHALGMPRTDSFFDQKYIESRREKVYQKYADLKGKEVLLYAPTFRDNTGDRTIFEPELSFEQLSKELLPNQVFVICPHPLMKNAIVPQSYDNIKVIRDFSTNDIMLVSDLLITDYSSVIFEYALLNKPIIFFCYDLIYYDRGFYLRYPEDLPGEVYQTQEELFDYLKDTKRHVISEKYQRFVKKYMGACDGKSSSRIAGIINEYLKKREKEK